ncbi:MAG: MATE family efflux transporter [Fuerstiella sp.]|jgi:MATE family multidrug resistance protein|nr:MATE family efflux transporter [Fuerstiella sp.]
MSETEFRSSAEQDSAQSNAGEPGSYRELLHVALPLIISSGSLSVMSAVDRMMLAGHSADALAAVTPASMLHWTIVCIPLGTILYANTFISQYDGAGRTSRLTASLFQAIWLAVISGILLMLVTPWTHTVLSMTGHEAGVVAEETIYFNTLCSGSSVLLLAMALSCFFSGRRQTQVVMYVNLTSTVLNFGLNYLLIFGHGPFPEMGIRGAAVATVAARFFDIAAYVVLMKRANRSGSFPFRQCWQIDRTLLRKYLRFGLPSGLHYFVDNSGFTVFLLIVGSLSRDALAATNLAFSVNGLIFVPLLGFGTAVQTLVGHHIGAGLQPAVVRTTWNAVRMAVVWTGTAALLLILFPAVSLMPFVAFSVDGSAAAESLQRLLPTATILLQFVAVYSVFDALAVVFASTLRGAGDTLFPMLITMFSSWFVMTLPAWWILSSGSATPQRLWLTCTVHIVFMGTMMLLRYRTGHWKQIHVIDDAGDGIKRPT